MVYEDTNSFFEGTEEIFELEGTTKKQMLRGGRPFILVAFPRKVG